MNPAPPAVTLGILAGGRATRLGGRDKAWLRIGGRAQVQRIVDRFALCCGQVRVSANRDLERYAAHGLIAVPDRHADIGPIGGLDALAAACATPWLFTVPVDVLDCGPAEFDVLASAAIGRGAVARDADGLQPLVALYDVAALRIALAATIGTGSHAVQGLQQRLGLPVVAVRTLRFGNLNTPLDLQDAGCDPN